MSGHWGNGGAAIAGVLPAIGKAAWREGLRPLPFTLKLAQQKCATVDFGVVAILCRRLGIAAGLLLLAGCAANGGIGHKADIPPISAEALQKAQSAPDVKEVAALGGSFSNYTMVGDLLRRAADTGNPVALVQLGDRYRRHGNGSKADLATAIDLYRQAAQQGYAKAEVALGKAYRLGQGVPLDKVEAAYWYRQAAQQNDAEGKLLYGIALLGGEGVAPDKQRAMLLIALNDVSDSPTEQKPGQLQGTPRLSDLTQDIAIRTIKLRVLAIVDAGKELSASEIDHIARDGANL